MLLSDNTTLLWLWLQQICGPASVMPPLLLAHFGSIEAIYEAEADAYAEVEHMTPRLAERLSSKELNEAREIFAYCRNEGVGLLTYDSALYPERLKALSNPPIVLYYKGILIDLDKELCLAMIGTRRMTEYGSHIAYSMAYDLATAGAVVISGMAKGIDGMAHRGALDAGGYTVAVLGCGIDRAYPAEHLSLMNNIIRQGLVLTEYKPFTPPAGQHFPVRNRIISGLGVGAVVVEAPTKSGALITASQAMKQGKDVFAVPGKLGEVTSTGANELIRDGARIVTSATDILLAYQERYADTMDLNRIAELRSRKFESPIRRVASPLPYLRREAEDEAIRRVLANSEEEMRLHREGLSSAKRPKAPSKAVSDRFTKEKRTERKEGTSPKAFSVPSHLTEEQKRILLLLAEESAVADRLSAVTERSVSEILSDLTLLEIEGCVVARPGGIYEIKSQS